MTCGALWIEGLRNGANGISEWICTRAGNGSIHCIRCSPVCLPIGVFVLLTNCQHHLEEPYESRGSRTVLWGAGVEIPLLTRLYVRPFSVVIYNVGLCRTLECCLCVDTRQALLQGWLMCVGFVCLANVPDLVALAIRNFAFVSFNCVY